jgi:hypothetical protein
MTDDEVQQQPLAVKKNYGLESLLTSTWDDRTKDLRSILRLKWCGRGYLLDGHGSLVSGGVVPKQVMISLRLLHFTGNRRFVTDATRDAEQKHA